MNDRHAMTRRERLIAALYLAGILACSYIAGLLIANPPRWT